MQNSTNNLEKKCPPPKKKGAGPRTHTLRAIPQVGLPLLRPQPLRADGAALQGGHLCGGADARSPSPPPPTPAWGWHRGKQWTCKMSPQGGGQGEGTTEKMSLAHGHKTES